MNSRISLFILDDNIPKTKEYIEEGIYERRIDKKELLSLATNHIWRGESSLQKIILDLLSHQYFQTEQIEVYGFLHPEICLSEMENGLKADIVIYDWEYGSSFQNSGKWLLEILNTTNAFVFVYSGIRDAIPPTLNKREFDAYATRFQLFSKGNITNSVFTSEDFIYQYILTRVNKSNTIKIQGIDVKFESNGYIESPTDILYLERILGKAFLIGKIKENSDILDDKTIEKILDDSNGYLLYNESKGVLVSPDENSLFEKLRPLTELSYKQVIKMFSIYKLEEVLEKGVGLI